MFVLSYEDICDSLIVLRIYTYFTGAKSINRYLLAIKLQKLHWIYYLCENAIFFLINIL